MTPTNDAYEAEARIGPSLTEPDVPPPAPYWDFAMLYRKQHDYAREVQILQRYLNYPGIPLDRADKYRERPDRAPALLASKGS